MSPEQQQQQQELLHFYTAMLAVKINLLCHSDTRARENTSHSPCELNLNRAIFYYSYHNFTSRGVHRFDSMYFIVALLDWHYCYDRDAVVMPSVKNNFARCCGWFNLVSRTELRRGRVLSMLATRVNIC